jgi:hypothetical protein
MLTEQKILSIFLLYIRIKFRQPPYEVLEVHLFKNN